MSLTTSTMIKTERAEFELTGSHEPNGHEAVEHCPNHSGKEPSPVVSHGKVNCRYLNTEQNTCNQTPNGYLNCSTL